jgi:DNA-directed RNA polymerase specialized sigma24 family protein
MLQSRLRASFSLPILKLIAYIHSRGPTVTTNHANTPECGSVTNLIRKVKQGDQSSLERLWVRYFKRLTRVAKRYMQRKPIASCDEEDIVSSSLDFLLSDRVHEVSNRDDLMRMLIVIVRNRVYSEARQINSLKHGGGKVSVLSDLDLPLQVHVQNLQSKLDGPEIVARVKDLYRFLRAQLQDEELKQICDMRVNGASCTEIGKHLNRTTRTINRHVQLIKSIWSDALKRELDNEP